jgi:hypothetical protein
MEQPGTQNKVLKARSEIANDGIIWIAKQKTEGPKLSMDGIVKDGRTRTNHGWKMEGLKLAFDLNSL